MDNEIINDVENIDNAETVDYYVLEDDSSSSNSSGKIIAGAIGAGVALMCTLVVHKVKPYVIAARETRREKKEAKKAAKESSDE